MAHTTALSGTFDLRSPVRPILCFLFLKFLMFLSLRPRSPLSRARAQAHLGVMHSKRIVTVVSCLLQVMAAAQCKPLTGRPRPSILQNLTLLHDTNTTSRPVASIVSPHVNILSYSWHRTGGVTVVGTAFIIQDGDTNSTRTTTKWHKDYLANETALLTRMDTNAAGTVTATLSYPFNINITV